MSDINICTFTGRLGADPQIKSFQNGGRVANLRIAVGDQWKDRQTGGRKERTEWVSVAITADGLVGIAERYLRKGSRVAVSGKLHTRKYQAQDGSDRYTIEIVLGSYGGTLTLLDSAEKGSRQDGGDGQGDGQHQPSRGGYDDLDEDSIPF